MYTFTFYHTKQALYDKGYMINLLFIRHRKHWHTHGSQGAVFHKMRAALLMSDSRRNGVYRRIIMSGAGTVVKVAHEFS